MLVNLDPEKLPWWLTLPCSIEIIAIFLFILFSSQLCLNFQGSLLNQENLPDLKKPRSLCTAQHSDCARG